MSFLIGTPSDDVPQVLATGRCVISTIFVSMCTRDPEGRDAEYLRWHTFDHRPEQYRLQEVRGSLRLVSTPECRAARARSETRYDGVDHVMTYFFSDVTGLKEFNDLAVALGDAGRIPYLLPLVERGVYRLDGLAAAPRVKIGADVLPWSPLQGAYLLIEHGREPSRQLADVPGVAGAWWGSSAVLNLEFPTADARPMSSAEGLQITYCFLDQDPVATAELMAPVLERRWATGTVEPLLAAPFFAVVGYDCDRHLP